MDNTIEATIETTIEERRTLPKNAFDQEYMTERLREVRFLAERGIKYTFVRKTPDYGVSQFKYRKTPRLFAALVEFYSMLEAERAVKRNISNEEFKQAKDVIDRILGKDDAKDNTEANPTNEAALKDSSLTEVNSRDSSLTGADLKDDTE